MDEYFDRLRKPTKKQIKFARSLGIDPVGKSFRVLSAEIEDQLEMNSYRYIDEKEIKSGDKVQYIGDRDDMPDQLIISSISKNGYLYFKGTKKYCRPWKVKPN